LSIPLPSAVFRPRIPRGDLRFPILANLRVAFVISDGPGSAFLT
jgi:hypothetical protein